MRFLEIYLVSVLCFAWEGFGVGAVAVPSARVRGCEGARVRGYGRGGRVVAFVLPGFCS